MHFILEMVALYDSGLWTMEVKELDNKELESPAVRIEKNTCLYVYFTERGNDGVWQNSSLYDQI